MVEESVVKAQEDELNDLSVKGHCFICHSSKNHALALQIVNTIESYGEKCWIAPRDILGSDTWGRSIVEALENSGVVIVLISAASIQSPQVLREIERSVHNEVPILPVLLEDVAVSKDFEYFLSACHWLDLKSADHTTICRTILGTVQKIKANYHGTKSEKLAKAHGEFPSVHQMSAAGHQVDFNADFISKKSFYLHLRLYFYRFLFLFLLLGGGIVYYLMPGKPPNLGKQEIELRPTPPVVLDDKLALRWETDTGLVRAKIAAIDQSRIDVKDISYEVERKFDDEKVVDIVGNREMIVTSNGLFQWRVRPIVEKKDWKGKWSDRYKVAFFPDAISWLKGVKVLNVVNHTAISADQAALSDSYLYKIFTLALAEVLEGSTVKIYDSEDATSRYFPSIVITPSNRHHTGTDITINPDQIFKIGVSERHTSGVLESPTVEEKLATLKGYVRGDIGSLNAIATLLKVHQTSGHQELPSIEYRYIDHLFNKHFGTKSHFISEAFALTGLPVSLSLHGDEFSEDLLKVIVQEIK